MNAPTKPRYRLGTQNMLDLAKDDARLIPENTLFKATDVHAAACDERGHPCISFNIVKNEAVLLRDDRGCCNDKNSVRFCTLDTSKWNYFSADMLKPFF